MFSLRGKSKQPENLPSVCALQLQYAIDAAHDPNRPRNIDDIYRITIKNNPEEASISGGTVISEIELSEHVDDTGAFRTYCKYLILREDGDETTTRIVKKRPESNTGLNLAVQGLGRAAIDIALPREDVFDIPNLELLDLITTIELNYSLAS